MNVPFGGRSPQTDDEKKMMEKMIDAFEDDDDVQNVWHNWEE